MALEGHIESRNLQRDTAHKWLKIINFWTHTYTGSNYNVCYKIIPLLICTIDYISVNTILFKKKLSNNNKIEIMFGMISNFVMSVNKLLESGIIYKCKFMLFTVSEKKVSSNLSLKYKKFMLEQIERNLICLVSI